MQRKNSWLPYCGPLVIWPNLRPPAGRFGVELWKSARLTGPYMRNGPTDRSHDLIASRWRGYCSTDSEVNLAASNEFPDGDSIKTLVAKALMKDGHTAAAELLDASTWTVAHPGVRIECPSLGKKMLALTFNGAAQKIIHQELQRVGGPTEFLVVPKH